MGTHNRYECDCVCVERRIGDLEAKLYSFWYYPCDSDQVHDSVSWKPLPLVLSHSAQGDEKRERERERRLQRRWRKTNIGYSLLLTSHYMRLFNVEVKLYPYFVWVSLRRVPGTGSEYFNYLHLHKRNQHMAQVIYRNLLFLRTISECYSCGKINSCKVSECVSEVAMSLPLISNNLFRFLLCTIMQLSNLAYSRSFGEKYPSRWSS
jgi:hypothetical protein